jgi:hypothetical protein
MTHTYIKKERMVFCEDAFPNLLYLNKRPPLLDFRAHAD